MLDIPVSSVIDIDEVPTLRARRGVHHLHRFAGRADERAVADGRARAQAREDQQRRRRRDLRARDPRQRDRTSRRIIDSLHRAGAEVVHGGSSPVHVSGHASQEELKLLLNLVQPEWFVPVHGEYTHMVHHARLARSGRRRRRTTCSSAKTATRSRSSARPTDHALDGRAPRGARRATIYVDGIVGDVGHGVLRDRRNLAEEGLVVVIVTVDSQAGRGRHRPRDRHPRLGLRARGRGAARGREGGGARRRSQEATDEGATDFDTLRRHARRSLGKFINERTKRRPAVIPVVMEV